MLTGKELSSLLRDNGYKVTPQRLAVYESLAKTKTHPNAEMLFKTLQPKFPAMSFATVYKSMEIFDRLNIITILNTGEDSYRYDADMSDHQHIQCTKCGRVDDLMVDSRDFTHKAELETGYRISEQKSYFYGVCPKCLAKEHN